MFVIKNFLKKIFTIKNLIKFLFNFSASFRIKFLLNFSISLRSRRFINNYFNINVFVDYWNNISIIYYLFLSCWTVFAHTLVNNYKFFLDLFPIIKKNCISMFNLTLGALNCIKNGFKNYKWNFKLYRRWFKSNWKK